MYRYKQIKLKDGSTRNEHRLIMEKHLGRKLTFNEVVDHIDGNQENNKLKNLRVMSRSEHTRMHYLKGDYALNKKETLEKIRLKAITKRLPHTNDRFTCCKCRKLKHRSQFRKSNSRWNGLHPYCKICHSRQNMLNKGK